MGWFWRNDSSSASSETVNNFIDEQLEDDLCTTTEVERTLWWCKTKKQKTLCKTKMVKPGKFVRKCKITKEIHCHWPGRSFVDIKTVYTEENLNALPKQVEDEKAILPAHLGIHVQRQMKSLLETGQDMINICRRRISAERK